MIQNGVDKILFPDSLSKQLGKSISRRLPLIMSVEHFGIADGLPDINVSVIHEDKNNRIWVGLRPNNTAAGLVLLVAEPQKNQNIVERHYREKEGLPDGWITDLFESSDGKFWVGTIRGLCEWQDGETAVCKTYTAKNDLCDAETWSITEDKDNNLWLGTRCGAKKWTRYGFTTYREADGLGAPIPNSIFETAAGELFVSFNTGTSRSDGERLNFTQYTPAEGLSSSGISCVTDDAFGRIYVGTGRGLDRLNPETGQIENFTTADGLPNSTVEIAYRDRKNNLWFGTTDGLARYVPEPERQRQPPNVLITGLRVSGIAQSVSILGEKEIAPFELDSDQRQVTVDFLGLGTNLGEQLKYEYRFGESDSTKTAERTVNFANLAAGAYQFEVRAQTADRIYSQPATVSFRISAPLWQRWWFVVSVLLLTALAIYLFYKNRVARLLEMERMRTRIATDLHDDIGANLTRISLLSEVAKQKSANGNGSLLTSIADIARESVASINDIVWAISPDHDSLLDLTVRMRRHAEEIFALRDIDLTFDAPVADADLKLSVGVRRDVLLIFKEAVNNAARHSDCTRVEINFRVSNATLFLRIEDNGKGFETTAENDGQGLRSMTRRARALGGCLEIDSPEKHGTTIELELPLSKMSQV